MGFFANFSYLVCMFSHRINEIKRKMFNVRHKKTILLLEHSFIIISASCSNGNQTERRHAIWFRLVCVSHYERGENEWSNNKQKAHLIVYICTYQVMYLDHHHRNGFVFACQTDKANNKDQKETRQKREKMVESEREKSQREMMLIANVTCYRMMLLSKNEKENYSSCQASLDRWLHRNKIKSLSDSYKKNIG